MALQVAVGGVAVPVLMNSISTDNAANSPGTATFTVTGSGLNVSQYQYVVVTDTVTGVDIYTGYIDQVDEVKSRGATTVMGWAVTCKDMRWLYDKRYWTDHEFFGWGAGDIAAELHRVLFVSEGIVASYAMRVDSTITDFSAGVLAGAVATATGLQLAAAGTDFTKTEDSSANFNAGTLTNVLGASGSLGLVSYPAIWYSGETIASLSSGNILSARRKLWAGSYTLVLNDELHTDVWIDGTSPEIKCGIDLLFNDGTWASDIPLNYQDQNGKFTYPAEDLNGWANDQWYVRTHTVDSTDAGKVVVGIYAVLMGQAAGAYSCYLKNVCITTSGGAITRVNVLSGASVTLPANVPASCSGYINLSCQVVTVYAETGQRLSAASSITAVGIVKGSVIDWVERDSVQSHASSGTYPAQVTIEMSIDGGATWQLCQNHVAMPSFLAGMNTSGITVQLRETLHVGGSNPQSTPYLDRVSYTVFSAPACTKTDYSDIDATPTQLGTGTLTNCTSYNPGGLMTTGFYRGWDDLNLTGQTLFGGGSPIMQPSKRAMSLRCDTVHACEARFDFVGNSYQNFIAEIDLWADDFTGGSEVGFIYRTTNWDNNDNSYAYAAQISGTQVQLRRAANGGTPATTLITSTALTLSAATFYRVKVVVNGSTHQVFINDIQYISVTDATYSAAGYVGVRTWNNTGARSSAHYDNFGIIAYAAALNSVSSRVTAALSLSGIVGVSQVNWQATVPSTSTLLVESTIDGGTTWTACTNGGAIPLLVPGYNAAGKSVKFRFTMTNQAVNVPIAIVGYSAYVIGQYSASGSRISPVLAIDNAGTQMGSSSVSWVAKTPTNTTVAIDSSLDNITYTNVGASGNGVNGLTTQGAVVADDFITNTAANYTVAFWTGGVLPTFTIDTANSRFTGLTGTNGVYIWTAFAAAKNISHELITSQCQDGGPVWRYTDVNNLYYAHLKDSGAGSNPITLEIRKRVAGVDSQILAPTALSGGFVRGTYHTLKITMIGTAIVATWDGIQVGSISDGSLTAAGQVGLYQNTSVNSYWYSIRCLLLGDSAVGKNVYSKIRLTSTDPTVTPLVNQVIVSVRGTDMMNGVIMPASQYAHQKTGGAIMDDLSKASGYNWWVETTTKRVKFKDRQYQTAPWPLYSADPLLMGATQPKNTKQSSLYRNRQYVYNAVALVTVGDAKAGDGQTQSWSLAYPIDSVQSIIIEGDGQSVGVLGVDTGMDFYYTPGSSTLSQDATQPVLALDQRFTITYTGRTPYTAMKEAISQQVALAAIDGTTGIIDASEDGKGISASDADTLAQARIDEYAILTRVFAYSTLRAGLLTGMMQTVFLPEHGFNDVDMAITDIKTTIKVTPTGGLWYWYDVTLTEGPHLGTWQRLLAEALAG